MTKRRIRPRKTHCLSLLLISLASRWRAGKCAFCKHPEVSCPCLYYLRWWY